MNFIDDIRRENLAALAEDVGGVAVLSRMLDREESQVSQWIRGAKHSVTGKKRGMKSETARWIEATTGKPPGWLDERHGQVKNHQIAQTLAAYHLRPLVQTVCNLAEQINDDGLRELAGFARCLTGTHPLKKTRAA